MSKYKFIGTEQDLIKEGFKLDDDTNDYVKEVNSTKIEGLYVPFVNLGAFIVLENSKKILIYDAPNGKNEYTGKYEWEEIKNAYIQDLIDKGLVVEND